MAGTAAPPGTGDLDFELEHVLAIAEARQRFPLPIDRIDSPEGSALILEIPPRGALPAASVDGTLPGPFAREVLEMMDVLHRRQWVTGGLEPSEFARAGPCEWTFLGTGHVCRAKSGADLSADLGHWARFCLGLLAGREIDPGSEGDRWLAARLGLGLGTSGEKRPATASELLTSPAGPASGRLWGWFRRREG